MSPLLKELEIIGSDVDNFECPWCGAHDRERHLLLYLRAVGLIPVPPGTSILHFAPERSLAALFATSEAGKYVRGDLCPSSTDIEKIDITAIDYPDETFDLILANHVLEHVPEDARALAEIFRVLKPGGHAILQTPYCDRLMNSWADPGIDTDTARCVAYGQEDHVRIYGRDIFSRICAAGFESRVATHGQLLPNVDAIRFGVNKREPLMLFRKSI